MLTPSDIEKIRQDFPILHQEINGHPLIYLDNAATTQKPRFVIDALQHYYYHDNANVHRGLHTLSDRATFKYEEARGKVQRFINASSSKECIFVKGTTEAINLVAQSFVTPRIQPGEEILLTVMEHHSNIVPWQIVSRKTGANLRIIPINAEGELDFAAFEKLITPNTKFLAITHISNALGTINPLKEIIRIAHDNDITVLVDGAQAAPHVAIDVQALDCDFYAFSGHKVFGPTGIGALYGRAELLEMMAPYQTGGEMISHVSFESTDYQMIPHKFEAGTPNIAGAIGLGAAIDYLEQLDSAKIAAYEAGLLEYATAALRSVKGLILIGTAQEKAPILSFIFGNIHAHDVGTILDSLGIAIRSGHHCAMPLMEYLDVAATSRISLSFYNTQAEIDRTVEALEQVRKVLA